ncbi:unnamed protein product, partial [Symbiodinium sp. KB8]
MASAVAGSSMVSMKQAPEPARPIEDVLASHVQEFTAQYTEESIPDSIMEKFRRLGGSETDEEACSHYFYGTLTLKSDSYNTLLRYNDAEMYLLAGTQYETAALIAATLKNQTDLTPHSANMLAKAYHDASVGITEEYGHHEEMARLVARSIVHAVGQGQKRAPDVYRGFLRAVVMIEQEYENETVTRDPINLERYRKTKKKLFSQAEADDAGWPVFPLEAVEEALSEFRPVLQELSKTHGAPPFSTEQFVPRTNEFDNWCIGYLGIPLRTRFLKGDN